MSPAARSLARRRASSLLASTRHSRAACGAPSPRVSPDPSEPCVSSAPSFRTSAPRRVSSPRDASALGVARVSSEARPRDGARGDDRAHSGVLLRDFLTKALYDKKDGYFARTAVPVGTIAEPIAFSSLLGADDYARALDLRYRRLAKQWLTPVEIFKPHYAEAVARYVLNRYREEDEKRGYPLRVYEIGGGSGTHAAGFLRYLRKHAPAVFAKTTFASVEISASLAAAAKKTVRDALDGETGLKRDATRRPSQSLSGERAFSRDSDVYSVVRGDAADRAAWGATDASPCFVVALEVLDNLPHDKVVLATTGDENGFARRDPRDKIWFQTRVRLDPETNAHVEHHSEPLSDALATRTLAAADAAEAEENERSFARRVARAAEAAFFPPGLAGSRAISYLPTGCLKLLETLHSARPNHRLVAADFDSLPGVTMPGQNAPLVATQARGGKTRDLPTYLAEVGDADVFFPTDFARLRVLNAAARRTVSMEDAVKRRDERARGEILSTRAFMEKWGDVEATTTRSGYNPLLQDFANTKFFLS